MEKRQFAVIGVGRFGRAVAKKLYEMGKEVLVIDKAEEIVADIADSVTHSVVADATDEQTLKKIGIRNFDIVIVAIGSSMQASIMTTLLCKELGAQYVVAKAQSWTHKKVLEKIGADLVVFPEDSMGNKIATILGLNNLVDFADIDDDLKVAEIEVPDEWVGASVVDLEVRRKHNLNVILIVRGTERFTQFDSQFVFEENDKVVLCGDIKDIQKLMR